MMRWHAAAYQSLEPPWAMIKYVQHQGYHAVMFQTLEDPWAATVFGLGDFSSGIQLRFDLWRTLKLHQCWGILVLFAIHSCRMLKCRISLFVVGGGCYLGSCGINMDCHFFRSPGAGAIRIVEWSFCSSGSTDRRSNTLSSVLQWGSSVDGFIIVIGQHVPVLMMLMN